MNDHDREPRYVRLQRAFEESNDGEPLNAVQQRHVTEEYLLFLQGVPESPIGRNLTPAQVDAQQAKRRLREQASKEKDERRESTKAFSRLFTVELNRLRTLKQSRVRAIHEALKLDQEPDQYLMIYHTDYTVPCSILPPPGMSVSDILDRADASYDECYATIDYHPRGRMYSESMPADCRWDDRS